jgi:NADH-quinone oxidoreductase subunit L
MITLIQLIPAFPFIGFLIIVFFGKFMSRKITGYVGAGSIGVSAVLTIIAGISFLTSPPDGGAYNVTVWNWLNTGGLVANVAFRFDALTLVFCFVITFVGALIHLYSIEFMQDDKGFARFFSYMNLFVASMLILVMADNLLLLYLGWEGVGLCSYLLIGFWYKEPANGNAAKKAFLITRIGDTAMVIGFFLLFLHLGTLNIADLMQQATLKWVAGSPLAVLSAAFLLGGALGKSAQLPLQTWLPDAMAGPSPVSALIHAATMVTAGVYLIARTHILFSLAPVVQTAIAIIGALTLLFAGLSALSQTDLKRVLAYSTISQIGYMFLALGIGAWSAAIFHFMIHAFFKALLFLGAGIVIYQLHHEHDMNKMGGLWKKMPVVFITFLIGASSLAALPLFTAGFYSKDEILWLAWSAKDGNHLLWLAAITGAFLTSLYTFRMIFLVFFGETKLEPDHKPGLQMMIPIVILAFFSLFAGYIELPDNFGHVHLFSSLITSYLPEVQMNATESPEFIFQLLSAIISLGGIFLAYRLYYKNSGIALSYNNSRISRFFYNGLGFDWFYNRILVNPVTWLSEIDRKDFTDKIYNGLSDLFLGFNRLLLKTHSGKLRWYVMGLTIGIVIILIIIISL